jgi:hypothetical protein
MNSVGDKVKSSIKMSVSVLTGNFRPFSISIANRDWVLTITSIEAGLTFFSLFDE